MRCRYKLVKTVPLETIQYVIWDTYRKYRFGSNLDIKGTDDPALKDLYKARIEFVSDFAHDVADRIDELEAASFRSWWRKIL